MVREIPAAPGQTDRQAGMDSQPRYRLSAIFFGFEFFSVQRVFLVNQQRTAQREEQEEEEEEGNPSHTTTQQQQTTAQQRDRRDETRRDQLDAMRKKDERGKKK